MARSVLRVTAPRDQAGPFEHLEVLGDRLQTHVERLSELIHRGLTPDQADQDGPPGRIGEGGEGETERVVRHE